MREELAEQWPLPLSRKRSCRRTRGGVPARRAHVGSHKGRGSGPEGARQASCGRSTAFCLARAAGSPGFVTCGDERVITERDTARTWHPAEAAFLGLGRGGLAPRWTSAGVGGPGRRGGAGRGRASLQNPGGGWAALGATGPRCGQRAGGKAWPPSETRSPWAPGMQSAGPGGRLCEHRPP